MNIVAIDFETSGYGRDSACALGMVRVEDGRVTDKWSRLIRPPSPQIMFTHIHGIIWEDVADAPTFGELWSDIADFIGEVDYLAAHNAGFDRGVLFGCCDAHAITPPYAPFICTVKLARAAWNIRPTKLPDVCHYHSIPLNHHDAASDANACGEIVKAAIEDGIDLTKGVLRPKKAR